MTRSFDKCAKRLGNHGLYVSIEDRAHKHGVSLRELYEGRATSIIAARRDVYSWLVKNGKSVNEVARLFDRAPNGVWKMTKWIK
jgi:hypothetical protein